MLKYFLITAVFIIAGCNTPQEILYLGEDNNGQSIELCQNEEIVISLSANITTGYTWAVSCIDTNYLKQVSEVQYKSSSNKMGSTGEQTFRFQTIAVGQMELKLIYHRPWEKDIAPLDSFYIKITVVKD